jgi:hypothetical protein
MNIYAPITITEEIEQNFKPTRLSVKELNGIRYLCKSTKQDFEEYKGSGVRWKRIVKKYGKKNIKTTWVSDWFYCPHHLQDFALMYSEYNQVVESEEWANLKPETGLDGGDCGHEGRKKISEKLQGIIPKHVKDKFLKKHTFIHDSGMIELATYSEMAAKYNISNSSLSQLTAGKIKSSHGWRISAEKIPNKNTSQDKFIFVHDDGRREFATRNEMIERYEVSRGNLNSVIRGERPVVKGWRFSP